MAETSGGPISRRTLLRGGGALVGGVAAASLLAACGSSSGPSGSTGAQTTLEKMKSKQYVRMSSYNQLAHDWFVNDKWTGMDIDIIQSFLPTIGVTHWDYVVSDWSGMIPGLIAGRWDLMSIGMSILPDREKQVLFSAPTYRSGSVLVVPVDSPIKGHSTFPGHKLGAVAGAGELDDIKSVAGTTAVAYQNSGQMFADIKAGRIDGCEMDEGEGSYALAANPISGLKVLHEWDGKVWYNQGIVMRKGNEDLKTVIDAYLAKIKADETMLNIVKKYGFDETNMVDAAGKPTAS